MYEEVINRFLMIYNSLTLYFVTACVHGKFRHKTLPKSKTLDTDLLTRLASGFLKLFRKVCAFVCLYICMSFVLDQVSKHLNGKSSLRTRNIGG